MRYKLRDLRLFPFFVLLLFLVLAIYNFRAKSRAHASLISAENIRQNPAFDRFDEFSPIVVNSNGIGADSGRFSLSASEKGELFHCRIRFRLKGESDLPVYLLWYKDSVLMSRDSVWAFAQDTLCAGEHWIPRNEAGSWSLDIMLRDNIILKTLSFRVDAQNNPRRLRSLRDGI